MDYLNLVIKLVGSLLVWLYRDAVPSLRDRTGTEHFETTTINKIIKDFLSGTINARVPKHFRAKETFS